MKGRKFKSALLIAVLAVCIASIFTVVALAAGEIKTEGEMTEIKNAFSPYLVQDTERIANDGYVGAIQYTVYFDKAHGSAKSGFGGTPVIVYAVNTNTERTGTDSNVTIISSMLERGYIVVVADYLNNPEATGHKLDDSAQAFARLVKFGNCFHGISGFATGTYHHTYVCPSGHNVLLDQVFWEVDKHSADGTLDKIVENWNTDFKGTKAEWLVKWATGSTTDTRKKVAKATDGTSPIWYNANGSENANGLYTKVKYTVAEAITDCVKPDGSPLDLDLKLYVVYPTNPKNEVPVLSVSSCWGYITNTHTCYTDLCSHNTGALFRGYAAATYDYFWQPMARDDAFGYYDGNLNTNGAVTGDHMNYSVHLYNDKLINTASQRYLRYLALSEPETYKFDLDKFCCIGLSKGAWFTFLGEEVLQSELVDASKYSSTADLETAIDLAIASFTNKRTFDNHHGETRYQAGNTSAISGGPYVGTNAIAGGEKQPWLTYNGVEIISGVQLTYAANGSQEEDISKGHAPMFAAAHMNDEYNAAYGSANTTANLARSLDIPFVFFEVDQLHEYAYFPDMFYGVETYDAFFDFANYYLKNAPIKVLYTDPYINDGDISLTDKITVQFSGAVDIKEVQKITVTAGGKALGGVWERIYGGTRWTFAPSDMIGGTEYTITVPADLKGDNGVAMGADYTASFITENSSDTALTEVSGKYTFTAPAALASGMDSYVFRFAVSNDAANIAGLYDSSDNLIGKVNLKGAGTYEIDITEYVCQNAGKQVTLALKTERAIGNVTLENRDFSNTTNIGTYSQAPSSIVKLDENGKEVASGDSAIKVYVADNEGRYGGGDVHYENVASVLSIQKVLGTNSVTKDDYGRQINITVEFMDTDSRTIQFKMWGMTNSSLGVMDYDVPLYNITTKAGEWMTVTVPYVVYEPDYGHTNNNTQTLFIALSPTGDTHKPIYFTNAKIEETVTDMVVTDAFLTAKNLGKASYRAPEAETSFALYNGSSLVGSFNTLQSAFSAYVSGYTLKLTSDYVLTNDDLYGDFGQRFASVTIDLNGYNIRCENTTNSLIWAKNTSSSIKKTSITLKNGGIELIERPLISFDGSSASGFGKTFDITLDNLNIRLGKQARLTELISASAITSGAGTDVTVRMNECAIDLGDEDERATVMLTLLPAGKGSLNLHYYVTGGSIKMSHPRWITVQNSASYTDYLRGENGHTKLYLPAAYAPTTKVSFMVEEGYAQYEAADTVANVTEYVLSRGEGSTRYGVIPDAYLSESAYPFALFKDGLFVGAYAKWGDALRNAQTSASGTANINTEVQLLLRSDYKNVSDPGPQINALTNLLIDLGGHAFISEDVGLDLSASYSTAPYSTNITVKNGKILSGRIAFVDGQIFNSATGEKIYNINFNNVTFGFDQNLGDFWNDMIYTPWTNVQSPYGVVNNLTFEGCVFDFRNYPRTSNYTVFNVKDGNQVLNVNIKLVGGEMLMDTAQYLTFAKLDSNDIITVAPDSDGEYIKLKTNSGVAPISDNFRDERGGNRSFSLESDDGTVAVYTLKTNPLATDYGVIDSAYADTQAYPFALFKDGGFIGAYTGFNKAMNAAISNSSGKTGESVLLMRRDFTLVKGDTSYLSDVNGNIRLDFGGYTLRAEWYVFDQYVTAGHLGKFGKFTAANGAMVHAADVPMIGMNQGGTNSTHKAFDISFEGVTFKNAYTTGNGIIFDCWDNNNTILDTKITFVDCTFDFTGAANGTLMIDAGSGKNYTDMDITVKGGKIVANDVSKYKIYSLGAEDSIVFVANKSGEYTSLVTSSATVPSTVAYPSDRPDTYFVKTEDDGVNSIYYLTSLKTEYGTPTVADLTNNSSYLSAVQYPFFIYYGGKFVAAETTWRRAIDKAETYVDSSAEIAASSEVYVVVRRDYVVNNANGSGTNFLNTMGKIVVDLSGYTMTNTDNYFIDIYVNYTNANYLSYVSSIEFKNGTLLNARPGSPMICIGHTGTNTNAKNLNFTFDNVTFKVAAGEKAFIQEWTGGSHVGSGVHASYYLNGCTFDYTGAGNGANFLNLSNDKNNTTLVINGGHIIADNFSNYKLYTTNNGDVAYLEADDNGRYITLTQRSSSAAPTATFKDKNGKVIAFGKDSSHGEFTDYVIGASIETKYGDIPYTYASAEQYPFAVFLNGKFVGAYSLFGKDATASALHSSKTAGSVILLRRDFTYTENQYNNLSQTHGVTLDLGGFTFTSKDRVMFHSQKKTAHNTAINVVNGTVVLGSKALMSLSSWDPSTGGWEAYPGGNGFIYTFDNVNIVLADGASTSDVICFNSFKAGDPDMFLDITFNNCTFDLSGSSKALLLFDMTHSLCKFDAKINGGKIVSSGAYLNLADTTNANALSSLTFGKQNNGNYTAFELPSGSEPNVSAINGAELVLVKVSDDGIKAIYRPRPKELADVEFVPKVSLTLDNSLVINVYVPAEDILNGFTLDGVDYVNLDELEKVTVDGNDYYLAKVPLDAKNAARDVILVANVTVNGINANATFKFGVIKYAQKVLADGSNIEKTLVCDVLSYVRAAYDYFGVSDAEKIAKINALLGENYDAENAPVMNGSADVPTEGLKAATFVLNSTPAIRFYLADGADASKYTFYADGKKLDFTEGSDSNGAYVEISVFAYLMGKTVEYRIDGIASGSYHIKSYYEFAKTQDNAKLVTLVERFAKYCESAEEYRLSVIGTEN